MALSQNIRYGRATRGVGTRTAVTTNTNACAFQVEIKALAANTGPIYIGDFNVLDTTGYELRPGDSVVLRLASASILYFTGATGDGLSWIGT